MLEAALRRPASLVVVVFSLASLLTLAELRVASHITAQPGEVPWVSLYEDPSSSIEKMLIRGDGQQFAMLAQDPLLRRPEVLNIDQPEAEFAYRAMRPGFGWLGWVSSAGESDLVPWAMVALTILSTVGLALAVARLALAADGDAIAGVLVLVLPGVIRLLGWTGPEITAAALACLATAAALGGRERQAVVLLTAAVLFRETLLLVGVGLVLARKLHWSTMAIPGVMIAAWVSVVRIVVGAWPGAGHRFDPGGFVDASRTWGFMGWYGMVLLVVLVAAAARRQPLLTWAVVLPHLALGLTMGESPWEYDAYSRVFLPVYAILLALAIPAPSEASPRGVCSLSSD